VLANGFEVIHAGIAAISEEQAVRQRRRLWQKLAFGLAVGRQRHGDDFVVAGLGQGDECRRGRATTSGARCPTPDTPPDAVEDGR
jgi:hypothetical protein